MTIDADDSAQDPVVPLRSCAAPVAAVPTAAIPTPPAAEAETLDYVADERRMSLGEHIDELRLRLIRCIAAFGICFFVGIFAYPWLWRMVRWPLTWAGEWTGQTAEQLVTFQWLGPMDGFTLVLRIDLILSVMIALPVIIRETWGFVSPGLTRREQRGVLAIFTAGSVLFTVGAAIAFRWATGIGMQFLIWFNNTLEGSVNQWTPEYYLSFLTMVCLGFGIAFETPLVMMALAWVGLITPEGIARYWRHAIMGAVIIGAIFTPPDPFSQIILATLLLALYFLGYLLTFVVARRRRQNSDTAA
jgi:sec-independent protein translocase protein TatC